MPEVRVDELNKLLPRVEEGEVEACYKASCYYMRCIGARDEKKAFELAQRAAAAGDADGLMNVGVCYYEGIGTKRDYTKAAACFEKSLQQGNTRVLNALAYMYAEGDGVEKDEQRALEYAERAVEENVPHSLSLLFHMHRDRVGGEQDFRKVESIVRKRIETNPEDGQAYYVLSAVMEQLCRDETEEIARALRKAAELGCAHAMYLLAKDYMTSDGYVPLNPELAVKWCRKGVEKRDGDSLLLMAAMHYHGYHVEKDWTKTADYTREAAAVGTPSAFCSLGLLYCKGEGVARDFAEAERCFRQSIAREPEYAEAYAELAICLLSSSDAAVKLEEVFNLALVGSALGDAPAYRLLGMAYEEGWAFEDGMRQLPDEMKANWCYAKADEIERSDAP